MVAWKRASLMTSEAPAADSATHSGPSGGCEVVSIRLACRASTECAPIPAPVSTSRPATPSVPAPRQRGRISVTGYSELH
eukprot:1398904-Pyramimonas_sp.AAC.1